ncbi:hypothetical protein AB1Y20_016822 [Prymnesium parvum]|uniref:Uncharacterized protein n=1 Tax=Prymnesium parvum TaxID=97485 RepID=A0AB34ID03_PRYPA
MEAAAARENAEKLIEELELLQAMPRVEGLTASSLFDRAKPPGSRAQLRGVIVRVSCCGEQVDQKCNDKEGAEACPDWVAAVRQLRAKIARKHGSAECLAKARPREATASTRSEPQLGEKTVLELMRAQLKIQKQQQSIARMERELAQILEAERRALQAEREAVAAREDKASQLKVAEEELNSLLGRVCDDRLLRRATVAASLAELQLAVVSTARLVFQLLLLCDTALSHTTRKPGVEEFWHFWVSPCFGATPIAPPEERTTGLALSLGTKMVLHAPARPPHRLLRMVPPPPAPSATPPSDAPASDSLAPLASLRALIAASSVARASPPTGAGPPSHGPSPFAALLVDAPPFRVRILEDKEHLIPQDSVAFSLRLPPDFLFRSLMDPAAVVMWREVLSS